MLTRQKVSTQATHNSSCMRFAAWLVERHGAAAGPEVMSVSEVAAYQQQLRAGGISEFTLRNARRSTRSSAGSSSTTSQTRGRRAWRCRSSLRAPQTRVRGGRSSRSPSPSTSVCSPTRSARSHITRCSARGMSRSSARLGSAGCGPRSCAASRARLTAPPVDSDRADVAGRPLATGDSTSTAAPASVGPASRSRRAAGGASDRGRERQAFVRGALVAGSRASTPGWKNVRVPMRSRLGFSGTKAAPATSEA